MATEIITRAEARAQGLKRYFTGKPCPYGHIVERMVSTCGCVTCIRIKSDARSLPGGSRAPKGPSANVAARAAARAKGQKKYSSGEPCHVGHVAERMVSTSQCCECLKAWKRARRAANRERYLAQDRRFKAANPERVRASYQKWQSSTGGKAVKARLQRERRARLRNASGSHTEQDVAEILAAQGGLCVYCRADIRHRYEVDHIVALAKGGSNDRSNIQVLCPPCNRRKRTKDHARFAREMGVVHEPATATPLAQKGD